MISQLSSTCERCLITPTAEEYDTRSVVGLQDISASHRGKLQISRYLRVLPKMAGSLIQKGWVTCGIKRCVRHRSEVQMSNCLRVLTPKVVS